MIKKKTRARRLSLVCALSLWGLAGSVHAVAEAAQMMQQPPGAEVSAIREVRQLNPTTFEVIMTRGAILSIDFYGANIVRLFQDPKGGIIRPPVATPPAQILVDQPRREAGHIRLESTSGHYRLSNGRIAVELDRRSGLMRLHDLRRRRLVLEQIKPFAYDRQGVSFAVAARDDEYFYGGGVQNGRFSHRGEAIAIENTNNWVDGGVASPTPYYWSTAGYSLLWHTFKPGHYDFGAKQPGQVQLGHSEEYLDLFLSVSETPVELLRDFYQLTGNPVLMPKFGFYQGHLNAYNRDYWTPAKDGFMLYEDGKRYNESQKDNGGIKESLNGEQNNYQFSARAAIDRYLDHDMPLGWFLPNDGYGAGYGQTNTLDGNIANLKAFGDYARSRGVEIGLWTQSDLHPKPGIEPLLQRDIVKEVRDAGVRALKTDVAWVGPGYSFGLNGVADVAHVMPYYGGDARPFIISLDGWAGTQRYATIWSGDQTGGEWEYIRFHIPTFIGSGLSGQPNITSDVDGIFGGKNVPVNVREFQWKTFTPMELNMDGWGRNPKYPHVLGEPATSINRWYLKLKSELMPYAYTIAHEAVTGKPMIRAMMLDYPNAYTLGVATQYQFLYGPYFLVAPIYRNQQMTESGDDVRHGIYLPQGRWIDYFNGDLYTGGRIINDFPAPLWKLPVFVKSGAIIPMTNPNNNVAGIRKDYRAYELYPDGQTSFVEYDDDGTTQAYLRGQSTTTKITSRLAQGRLVVELQPTQGSFEGFVKDKVTELRINTTARPQAVSARVGRAKRSLRQVHRLEDFERGQDVYFYHERPNLNRFSTKGSPFEQQQVIKNPQLLVKLSPTDVTKYSVEVEVSGFRFSPKDPLLSRRGALGVPQWQEGQFALEPRQARLVWGQVQGADYYELEHRGMILSTIRGTSFVIEDLEPQQRYDLKLRAVNASGTSPWVSLTIETKRDPLEHTVRGISGTTSCQNQGGSGINALFDRDEKKMWHTAWNQKAVPFTLTIDLRSVNELDKIVYLPREDAANGTILKGSIAYSLDKMSWSEAQPFVWERNAAEKTFAWPDKPKARYIRLEVSQAVGNFGSGRELYVFRVPGSQSQLQGDINRDKVIDDNDWTSYLNYTGLRRQDADFDYISLGDLNRNGLIDAYDIAHVGTMLDGGARVRPEDQVSGRLVLTPSLAQVEAGQELEISVRGSVDMKAVNALSFALPYDASLWEFVGIEAKGTKQMINLTYDRLHSDGSKALYPTFVNRGHEATLSGSSELLVIKLRARRAGKVSLKALDGILVDRGLGVVHF